MSLLTSLPEVIGFEIMSHWLSLADLARNDTAHTSTEDREQLLSILSKDVLSCGCSFSLNFDAIKWVSRRKIALSVLSITLHFEWKNATELPIITKHILKLCISNNFENSQFVAQLVNSCENLEDLTFERGVHNLHEIDGEILSRLKSINVRTVLPNSNDKEGSWEINCETSFKILIKHCRNLTAVGYSNYYYNGVPDSICSSVCQLDFIELLKCNPKIKSIESVILYEGNDELLKGIAKYCPNLERIDGLMLLHHYSVVNIADIIQSCPKLQSIDTGYQYTADTSGSFSYSKPKQATLTNNSSGNVDLTKVTAIEKNSVYTHSIGYDAGELETFFKRIGDFNYIGLINSFIEPISAELLRSIANNNPNLETLDITACTFADPFPCSDFSFVFNSCKQLHTLSLHDSVISDHDVRQLLAVERKQLTDLKIPEHESLTSDTLHAILNANKQLKRLCVSECLLVDEYAIAAEYPDLILYSVDDDDEVDSNDDDDSGESGEEESGEEDSAQEGSDDESVVGEEESDEDDSEESN